MKREKSKVEVKEEKITIPPIPIKTCKITIDGISPLMVNKFDEKSKRQLDESHQGKAKTKKAPRVPQEEYEASFYHTKDGGYGIPASGVKQCAVSACRFIDGVPMTLAKGAFHVLAGPDGLVEVKGKPCMDERIVRVGNFGNKKPMTRYRGRFDKWSITFPVQYNANVITPEQLCNLYENAGFSIGLCEWRPEKNGSYGMFTVQRG